MKHVHTKTGTQLFMGDLFLVAPNRKQPKYVSTVEWIYKWGYIHMMRFYSTKRVLIQAKTRMNLKITMLFETSQREKEYIIYIFLYIKCGKYKLSCSDRKWMSVSPG